MRRYDRDPDAPPDGRLHQEDFCQGLRVVPAEKYESDGGPGVADCAGLLWKASSAPARDVTAFLDALLFNFLIGNHDAHAKNYSLLLEGPGAIRLAPLYDLICSEFQARPILDEVGAVLSERRERLSTALGEARAIA